MGKLRKWRSFISVSASGPESSPIFEERGYFMRPRMAADLRYTTADVDYFADHWQTDGYESGLEERRRRLVNPTRATVLAEIRDTGVWRRTFTSRPDWDGGDLTFTFAGH